MAQRTVLIAAGGTGGHLFPAAAFAQEMRARGWRVALMTDARGRRYAADFPADTLEEVAAATIQGFNPINAGLAAIKIALGVSAARKRLQALDPAVVAGFGGYPSLPALTAARLAKRPIVIHEQNAVLGRVNRRFAASAEVVASGFARLDLLPAQAKARHVVVGNPVRPPILAARERDYAPVTPGGPIRILVIGGSQGARILGSTIPAAVARLPDDLRARVHMVQQVREEQLAAAKKIYAQAQVQADLSPFFSDMPERYSGAHLVIARAGASTVTEVAAVGRPAIFVPLAIATDDHQTANAEALVAVGAADQIQEKELTADHLAALLDERLRDPHGLAVRAAAAKAVGRVDAARTLADLAERVAAGQSLF